MNYLLFFEIMNYFLFFCDMELSLVFLCVNELSLVFLGNGLFFYFFFCDNVNLLDYLFVSLLLIFFNFLGLDCPLCGAQLGRSSCVLFLCFPQREGERFRMSCVGVHGELLFLVCLHRLTDALQVLLSLVAKSGTNT